jgi:hypothetical protein
MLAALIASAIIGGVGVAVGAAGIGVSATQSKEAQKAQEKANEEAARKNRVSVPNTAQRSNYVSGGF